MLPASEDVSEYEHPLTREELATMIQPFKVEGTRYFRLPFVPLVSRVLPSKSNSALRTSNWILQHWTAGERYATVVVAKFEKQAQQISGEQPGIRLARSPQLAAII
jgi:hypothetical protein